MFMPIIKEINTLTSYQYDVNAYFSDNVKQKNINRDFKIIADHLKACTFAIADGVHPSNKERGSIIRRLIRRAMVCARRLKIENKFTALISKVVIKTMANYYPYLVTKQDEITNALTKEEELFAKTLENGYKLFEQALIQNKNELPTDTIFKLVDTYGFPFEIIQELAKENHLTIDLDAYKQRFSKHQDVSRANIETKGMLQQHNDLINFVQPSIFDYDITTVENTKIIGLFDLDFKQVDKVSHGYFVTDITCFYATSGGQVCDSGYAIIDGKHYDILNVIKMPNGQHLHLVELKHGALTINKGISLYINAANRKKASANHTVEHLLQYVLRKYISQDIQQEGAFKSSEKVTFDFHYNKKITDEQIKLIQTEVNKLIKQSLNVKVDYMSLVKAKEYGALA
jgi:alanyl-tRNA synthetase